MSEDQAKRINAARTVLDNVFNELVDAMAKHPPMHSAHEGYAVTLEELDEVWDAVKKDDLVHAKKEMKQVAAMAVRFLVDL